MQDLSELNQTFQAESLSQKYLEKLSPEDANNLKLLQNALSQTLKDGELKGFIYAVGGTTTNDNPKTRKDIDLLIGIDKDFGETSKLTSLGLYLLRFGEFKETMIKVFEPLQENGEIINVVEESVYPDHERENIAANDGKFTVSFRTGKPIDLICYQNTDIKPVAIELFSNVTQIAA